MTDITVQDTAALGTAVRLAARGDEAAFCRSATPAGRAGRLLADIEAGAYAVVDVAVADYARIREPFATFMRTRTSGSSTPPSSRSSCD